MIYLVFLGGVLTGSVLISILNGLRETYGKLLIDPKEDTCQVCMDTKKVIKKRTKRVVLISDHNTDLEQK